MLLELRVENLLLIERAELQLGPGLTAITGETGAGKTILAHALDLLLGGRPRSGIVRPGAREAYVEGVFACPPGGLVGDELAELRERLPEGEDELVLGRRVGAEGRSRAFVQGRSASASDLRDLGSRLLAFFGQHEHRKLTVASAQLDLLDAFCGAEHLALRDRYSAQHRHVAAIARELESLRGRAGALDRDRDLLAFEIEEIEELDPSAADEEALLAERGRLRSLDALREAAGGAAEALAPDGAEATGAVAALALAEQHAGAASGADSELDGLAARLATLRIEAEDLAGELRRYLEGLYAEPGRLEDVEARLDRYDRLKRKHGGSVEAVLAHAARCRAERERLESAEVDLARYEAELESRGAEERRLASELGKARRAAAPRLAKAVREELAQLAMEEAQFDVRLEPRGELAATGGERAEFLVAPNPGVPAGALREIASGGELSRVMLALMSVAGTGGAETLVFDEVDAGVGGQTARAVGERLRRLADDRQVLCITHLPQIAAMADSHFRIEKDGSAGVSQASVDALEGQAVVAELCRMLGADSSDAGARRHARELLAAAA